jgi:hypothetical protein
MKLTIAPRKLRQGSPSYVEVRSDNIAVVLPDALSTEALSFLEESEIRLEVAIGRLQSINSNIKRDYMKGIKETYDTLMLAIHSAQTNNRAMLCRISGTYDYRHTMPCIENWTHCNPGRMAAINYIICELRANGWQPEPLKLSPFLVGAEDHLCSGGTDIIVQCDFTQVID